MRETTLTSEFFSRNREIVKEQIGHHAIALVQAAPESIRNADSLHKWRQDSVFYYYTGIDYPDCSLLLIPTPSGENSEMLFIPVVDPEKEKWNGKMLTKEQAKEVSGIKTVLYNDSLLQVLFRVQRWREALYYELDEFYPELSLTPQHLLLSDLRKRLPGLQQKKMSILSVLQRTKKQPEEIELVKKSLSIIKGALNRVVKTMKPGMMEYQVEAELTHHYLFEGCERHGFDPIVAGGVNATVLHYVENSKPLKDGDLVLIDTGGEYRMYSGDITRTYPINGKFSERQKKCYQAVLDVNKMFIEGLEPGKSWNELFDAASKLTGEIYADYGLIEDPKKHLSVSYHKIGHYLGLDVHDTGRPNDPMQSGTLITVEPGLYLPDEGIGIRIEDNVLLTNDGYEVLSKDIPKEIEDIEALMK